MSNYHYSFQQYCIDNNRLDLLDRWDYDLNQISPNEVSFKSNKKMYFKCENNRHNSESFLIYDITSGKIKFICCRKCKSFAQYIIDNYSEEYLYKIWNASNDKSPWEISASSNKRVTLNCDTNPNHIYDISPDHYQDAKIPCPYCGGRKIVPKSSAAALNGRIAILWSDKNIDSPYDYSLHSSHKAWWKCENNIHEDYERSLCSSYEQEYMCPKCAFKRASDSRRKDLTGKQVGTLSVLYVDEDMTKQKGRVYWVCKCSCGRIVSKDGSHLSNNTVSTCGDRKSHYSGENNGNWKGGITPENLSARTSKEYNEWRDAVYAKDWYTCQCCGKYINIEKQAHHINNFSNNTDIRYDVNNGICLCKECHYTTIQGSFHNIYGTQNNNAEQLEEYINSKRKELNIPISFNYTNYKNGLIVKPHDFDMYFTRC